MSYGLEAMLRKTGRLSGWLSYTLSKSTRQFDAIDGGQAFPSKFDRRHNLSIVAIYELSDRLTLSGTQIIASGNRFTAPTSWYFIANNPVKEYDKHNNARMPLYNRTDISITYDLQPKDGRQSELFLSIHNLFIIKNPIYVVLDTAANHTGNAIEIKARYKTIYTILPSLGWRFKF